MASSTDIEVTAGMWRIDEQVMARCAERGFASLVVIVTTHDSVALQSFLDQYRDVTGRICG